MKKDEIYINHILDAIELVEKFTLNITRGQFVKDKMIHSAVIRQLEIIGEAAKNISDEFKKAHPDIPWKTITGMRNKLIHAYFGVDLFLVWDTVTIDIPDLKSEIQSWLK
ncbi:MAG: DUF86 domain-containing protein [candidate division Zixibacteria bacterium]|nr:DUF86 domain-containing protein [Candidatus Tariuqbacter arcticus]